MTLPQPIPDSQGKFRPAVQASVDGCALEQYSEGGTALTLNDLTVRGEVDKLASDIGIARMWAGVQWRTDHTYSLLLGEMVAVSLLVDQALTFSEEHYFEFTSFTGDRITIGRTGLARRRPGNERSTVSLCGKPRGTFTGYL